MLLNKRLTSFLLLLATFGFGVADIINVIIDPSVRTNPAAGQYSSFYDLMKFTATFEYQTPTTLIIQIPPNTKVPLDSNCSFGPGKNLEISLQGGDRKSSIVNFSSYSGMNFSSIDFTITNLTISNSDRKTNSSFINSSNATLTLKNSDVSLATIAWNDPTTKFLTTPIFLYSNLAAIIDNVNVSITGPYVFMTSPSKGANLTVNNTAFSIFQGLNGNFISVSAQKNQYKQHARLDNLSFQLSDTGKYNVEPCYLCFEFLDAFVVNGISVMMGNNTDFLNFLEMKESQRFSISNININVSSPNVTFQTILKITRAASTSQGPSSLSNFYFTGPGQKILNESERAIIEYTQFEACTLEIKNIEAHNMVFYQTGFLKLEIAVYEDILIDTIRIQNSLVYSNVIEIATLSRIFGSAFFEENTTTLTVRGLEVSGSQIFVSRVPDAIISLTHPLFGDYKKPFMDTLRLDGLKIINNQVVKQDLDIFNLNMEIIKTFGKNFFVVNSEISGNTFYRTTVFKMQETQPNIRFSNVSILNTSFEDSVLVKKALDPKSSVLYLLCNLSVCSQEVVPNYRYMVLENSTFDRLILQDSALFQGNIMNFIARYNRFNLFSLNRSTIFEFKYMLANEAPARFINSTNHSLGPTDYPSVNNPLAFGHPAILISDNVFANSSLNKSLIVSVSNFDVFLRFEYFYSQVEVNNNTFSNFSDISKSPNNLLNFWYSGNIIISNNTFKKVYTVGDIFCVKYNDRELQENGLMNTYGAFVFVNNSFYGSNDAIIINKTNLNSSQTSILNLEMSRVREFRFELNVIFECVTINRGLINIKIKMAPGASNTISFSGNNLRDNQLVAGNDLKGNFIIFECNPTYPKILGPRPEILFNHNLLSLNMIDGGLLLTGSLLSLMPTFIQIRAPEYALRVSNLGIMGSSFKAYGYLFTAIALSVEIKESQIRGCRFNEEERLIYIDSPTTGMQGIFFFSSPSIVISDILLESNMIQKGSYFFLDNYWIHNNILPIHNWTQSISFNVSDSHFIRNQVAKGAIVMYSGGFFGVFVNLDNIFVNNAGVLMDYFLKVSDPSYFKLKAKNSTFKIDKMGSTNCSSNLFYLDNFDPAAHKRNLNDHPVIIDNCTFHTVYNDKAIFTPEISIINRGEKTLQTSTYSVKFSKTKFLPVSRDTEIPPNVIGGLKFRIIGSGVMFEECLFQSLETGVSPLFDGSEQSFVNFVDTVFMANRIRLGTPLLQLTGSNLVFYGVAVVGNVINSTFIELITKEQGNYFTVQNSDFTGNMLNNGSAFINNKQTSYGPGVLTINGSLFQKNKLNEQSNCIRSNGVLSIVNSDFRENNGSDSVGTVLVSRGTYNIKIISTKFVSNVARAGGAIDVTDVANISNCLFMGNTARDGAGAVLISKKFYSSLLNSIVTKNNFVNNTAPVGADYLAYPDHLTYKIVHFDSKGMNIFNEPEQKDNVSIVANFTPGATLGFGINVTVYDAFNNSIPNSIFEYQKSPGKLELHRVTSLSSSQAILFDSSDGEWSDTSLLLRGTNVSLATTFDSFVTMNVTTKIQGIELSFKIAARADSYCQRGHIYDENLMKCQECGSGWYARGFNQSKCLTCPQAASCYGGLDQVNISKGYWADMSQETITPIKCSNNPRACLGDLNSSCEEGHYGPTCDDCDYLGVIKGSRYVKAGFSRCNKCGSLTESILYALLVGLLTLIGEAVFVAVNIISNDRYVMNIGSSVQKNPTGSYFRLLATYFQILYIIRTFNIEIPKFLSWILNVGNPTQAFFQSSQCLIIDYWLLHLQGNISLPYFSSLVTFGLLFIKYLLYLLLWVILKITRGGRIKFRHLAVAFISLFYLEQPSFVNSIFAIVSCKQIGNSEYLTQYPSSPCSTDEYRFYLHYVGLPLMAAIMLLFPGVILFKLFRKRQELKSKKVLFTFGTLVSDYKSKYFYWTFVLMVLKLCLIIFSNLFPNSREFDLKIKALGLILVFTLYLFMILKFKPYSQTRVYNMDRYLTYLNISTIFFTYLSLGSDFEKIDDGVYWVCFLSVLITNVLFILYVIKMVYHANAAKAQIMAKRITLLFSRKKEDTLLLNDTDEVANGSLSLDDDSDSGSNSKLNLNESGSFLLNSLVETQEKSSFVATVYQKNEEKPL